MIGDLVGILRRGNRGERGDGQTVFIIVGAACGILALLLLLL